MYTDTTLLTSTSILLDLFDESNNSEANLRHGHHEARLSLTLTARMSFLDQARSNLQRSLRRDSVSNDTRKQSTSTVPNPQIVQPSTSYTNWVNPSRWKPAAAPADPHPPAAPKLKPRPQRLLSPLSSPGVPNSLWFASDIQLAASVVIIQPSTSKFVVLSEKKKLRAGNRVEESEYWFLPRGRKDIGESLEQTALREGYEEVIYSLINDI